MKHSRIKLSFQRLCDVNTDLFKSLVKLDLDVMRHPWTEGAWVDAYKRGSFLLLSACFEETLYGVILGRWDPFNNVFDLDKIMVNQIYQEEGVGQALLSELPEFILKEGKNIKKEFEIFLEVDSANQKALEFYKKNGFILVRLVRKFYSNGSDGKILKKIIRI